MEKWERELDTILSGLGVHEEEEICLAEMDFSDIQQSIRSTMCTVRRLLCDSSFTPQTREDIDVLLLFLRMQMRREAEGEQMGYASVLLRFCRIVLTFMEEK